MLHYEFIDGKAVLVGNTNAFGNYRAINLPSPEENGAGDDTIAGGSGTDYEGGDVTSGSVTVTEDDVTVFVDGGAYGDEDAAPPPRIYTGDDIVRLEIDSPGGEGGDVYEVRDTGESDKQTTIVFNPGGRTVNSTEVFRGQDKQVFVKEEYDIQTLSYRYKLTQENQTDDGRYETTKEVFNGSSTTVVHREPLPSGGYLETITTTNSSGNTSTISDEIDRNGNPVKDRNNNHDTNTSTDTSTNTGSETRFNTIGSNASDFTVTTDSSDIRILVACQADMRLRRGFSAAVAFISSIIDASIPPYLARHL